MAIFNSYAGLPEGIPILITCVWWSTTLELQKKVQATPKKTRVYDTYTIHLSIEYS